MKKYTTIALALAAVMLISAVSLANFKVLADMPLELSVAKSEIEKLVPVNFAEGTAVGIWKSLQSKTPYNKGEMTVRLAFDGLKLACLQTEFAVSMNDFMTYDWYAYGDFHGRLFKAATGLDDVKFAQALNKLMDEVYGKIMGQYRGEIYFMPANGMNVGVRLKTAQGMLNVFYYLNEPMFNADGTARTDMKFFELK
jgi:hypothetical protein